MNNTFKKDLQAIYDEVTAHHSDVDYSEFSMCVFDINTENYWGINDQLTAETENLGTHGNFIAASVIKFPICYALIKMAEAGEVDLYGYYSDPISGLEFRPIDKMQDALRISSNLAINNLIRTFSITNINDEMTALGYPNLKMFSEIGPGDPDKSYSNNIERYGNTLGGRINCYEVAKAYLDFYRDYQGGVVGTAELFTAMKENIYTDRIPQGINYAYDVIHKTGTTGMPEGVVDDCGIIMIEDRPFIICFINQNQSEDAAESLERELALEMTKYMETATLININDEKEMQETAACIDLDGVKLDFTTPLFIKNDRVLVPFRTFSEHLQFEVLWEAESEKVVSYNEGCKIEFILNNAEAIVNGEIMSMDVPPFEINGCSYVPVRFIAEAYGLKVTWDESELFVHITHQE
jgi:hypothetical protein